MGYVFRFPRELADERATLRKGKELLKLKSSKQRERTGIEFEGDAFSVLLGTLLKPIRYTKYRIICDCFGVWLCDTHEKLKLLPPTNSSLATQEARYTNLHRLDGQHCLKSLIGFVAAGGAYVWKMSFFLCSFTQH